MSKELRAQADRLFEQGLFLYKDSHTPEGLKAVADLWQRALDLYRRIGDQAKIKEIQSCFTRLSKKVLKPKSSRKSGGAIAPLESITKPRPEKSFKAWDVFLKIGLFGVGGPLAVLGLLQEELVNRKKVMTNKDFLEGAVLGDILPGPVTMDIVTYTGYKLRGWTGAAYSTLLFILPSFILMIFLAVLYNKYNSLPLITNIFQCLGAAITAIIISVGLQLGKEEIRDYIGVGIFLWAFVSSMIFRFDILIVVGLAGVVGMLLNVLPPTTHRLR